MISFPFLSSSMPTSEEIDAFIQEKQNHSQNDSEASATQVRFQQSPIGLG
jgi:hypothetical protein